MQATIWVRVFVLIQKPARNEVESDSRSNKLKTSLGLNFNRSAEKSQVFHKEKDASVLYLSMDSLMHNLQIYITKMGE